MEPLRYLRDLAPRRIYLGRRRRVEPQGTQLGNPWPEDGIRSSALGFLIADR